jgi:hypothetical protein
MTDTKGLWGITSYYNPAGFRRRLENYHSFRRRLTVPLVTVELSFGRPFELEAGDADILVQLRGQAVLWQKERLLNVALKHLPPDCNSVAWIDCDVIFVDDRWAQSTCEQLDRFPLVQLFNGLYDLDRDDHLKSADRQLSARFAGRSLGATLAKGSTPAHCGSAKSPRLTGGALLGLAWAGRREVLEATGFYDACILGSGVRAMAFAALARYQDVVQFLQMNLRQEEHYLRWAEQWRDLVKGRLGYIETSLLHLWHGDTKNRGYASRHEHFARYGFDPYLDLALDDVGCWRWNTAKPEMHQFVKEYFASRREDG